MQLLPDGSISFTIADKTVRVKAPNVGQYRKIQERINARDDQRRVELEQWKQDAGADYPTDEQIEKSQAETDPTPLTAPQIVALNAVNRKATRWNEEGLLAVWHMILIGEELGDSPFPKLALDDVPTVNTDEWPLELLSAATYNLAMNHWVTVPLASGAAPAPATS